MGNVRRGDHDDGLCGCGMSPLVSLVVLVVVNGHFSGLCWSQFVSSTRWFRWTFSSSCCF